jgi:hypothetical protein
VKIISGGQTGADQAALDAAIRTQTAHGGWIPKGRKTEEGPLPKKYHLQEMSSRNYRDRTEKNILEGDATLICSHGPLTGGSALTEALAIRHKKPLLHLDFTHYSLDKAMDTLNKWLQAHSVQILNVAGPRASGDPQIYQKVYQLLCAVCGPLQNSEDS